MSVMSVIGEKGVCTRLAETATGKKSDLIYKDLNERLGIERKDRPEASRACIDGGKGRGKKGREEARRPQVPVLPKSASLGAQGPEGETMTLTDKQTGPRYGGMCPEPICQHKRRRRVCRIRRGYPASTGSLIGWPLPSDPGASPDIVGLE